MWAAFHGVCIGAQGQKGLKGNQGVKGAEGAEGIKGLKARDIQNFKLTIVLWVIM